MRVPGWIQEDNIRFKRLLYEMNRRETEREIENHIVMEGDCRKRKRENYYALKHDDDNVIIYLSLFH